jgi:hypothetical protein
VSLLDSHPEEPRSRALRYSVSGVAFLLLMAFGIWFLLRFYPEKRTVARFMDAVTAGNLQLAYQIWKPHGTSYTFDDFTADWGTKGYYGPIESYRIETANSPRNGGSGIIVVIETSPYRPFPDEKDPKSRRNRDIRLWVERSDQSISFPP